MSVSEGQEEEVHIEVPRFLVGFEDHVCEELECGNMNVSEPYDEEEEDDDLVKTLQLLNLRCGQEGSVALGRK